VRLRLATFNVEGLAVAPAGDSSGEVLTSTTTRVQIEAGTGLMRGAADVEGPGLRTRSAEERRALARRVRDLDADVLCLQEVEHDGTLRALNAGDEGEGGLAGAYGHAAHVGSRDHRLGGLAILSRLPFGTIASWGHLDRAERPGHPMFPRGVVEVEILHRQGGPTAVHLFVVHLADPLLEGGETTGLRRRRSREAAGVAELVGRRASRRSAVAVVGTFAADPDASELAPISDLAAPRLRNGLSHARPTKSLAGTPDAPWTVIDQDGRARFWDHLWLSEHLAERVVDAGVDRREHPDGDGSRHDPAWVTVNASGRGSGGPGTRAAPPPRMTARVRARPARASPVAPAAHQHG